MFIVRTTLYKSTRYNRISSTSCINCCVMTITNKQHDYYKKCEDIKKNSD